MQSNRILACLVCFTLNGCLFGSAPEIRFQNATDVDFEQLEVRFGVTETFVDLRAGELTEYRSFDGAFQIGYVQATTAEEIAVIHVKDFEGEEQLDSGSYLYVVSERPSADGLRISGKMSEE